MVSFGCGHGLGGFLSREVTGPDSFGDDDTGDGLEEKERTLS